MKHKSAIFLAFLVTITLIHNVGEFCPSINVDSYPQTYLEFRRFDTIQLVCLVKNLRPEDDGVSYLSNASGTSQYYTVSSGITISGTITI